MANHREMEIRAANPRPVPPLPSLGGVVLTPLAVAVIAIALGSFGEVTE
jgi:hypothetical protein